MCSIFTCVTHVHFKHSPPECVGIWCVGFNVTQLYRPPPLSRTAANSTIPMGGTQPTQRVQDGGQLTKRPTRRVHRDIPTSDWRSPSSGRVWGYGYASKSTDPQTSACTANEHNRTGRRRTTSGTQACPHYCVAHVPSPTLPTIMWLCVNARASTHLHTNMPSDSQTHTTAHVSIACGSTKKNTERGGRGVGGEGDQPLLSEGLEGGP